jgi:anti-sigma regulatory factor (Ser/Thr protein kinase)
MVPFVRGGLERGDDVLAVTSRRNSEALRDALGDDAAAVSYRASEEWYASPGRAFQAWVDYVSRLEPGRRLCAIGEVVWPVDWVAGIEEWAKYESMSNEVFASAPAWITCPYDVSSLPAPIVEHALEAHPALHDHGCRTPHDRYVEPREFWTKLEQAAPILPPHTALRLPVTADLASLRHAVAADARRAGVSAGKVPELLIAVHELAINALSHGGGSATLATWADGPYFVCEIADRGPGLTLAYPGYAPPAPDSPRGRGFWLARQFCDVVQVRTTPEGTRVRVQTRIR